MYFFNALFTDLPEYQLDRLQQVQNHAARVVLNATYEHRSVDLLKTPHWLPIRARVMFKVFMIVFHVHQETSPSYIQSMFKRVQPKQYRLRSASTNQVQFEVPRNRTKMADRSLAVVGSRWWNNLQLDLKTVNTENMFGKRLKPFLFQIFYDRKEASLIFCHFPYLAPMKVL